MRTALYILAVVIIAGGAWLLLRGDDSVVPEESLLQDISSFESEAYGFSLEYPQEWRISTSTLVDGTPAFSVYMREASTPDGPFTHHNNVTNVSVFPEGVPTEGIFADQMPLSFDPGFAATNTMMFVLADGTPFAAYLQLQPPPERWGESGFVWIRVRLENAEMQCFDENAESVVEEECDPLGGSDRIRWSGTRNPDEWDTALQALRSLEFN